MLHRSCSLVVRIDLDERFRPVSPALIGLFDFGRYVLRRDLHKAPGEGTVAVDEVVAEAEDVLHEAIRGMLAQQVVASPLLFYAMRDLC